MRDGWGHEIAIRPSTACVGLELRSSGPDGMLGTPDDITNTWCCPKDH
jgi:hypothetical protein